MKDSLEFNMTAFVPKKDERKYIRRQVDDELKFWLDMKNDRGQRESVALIGEAGSGKNQLVYNYGIETDLPLLVIPCDDSQVLNQLLGYWQAVDGTTVWKEGLLCSFVRKPSIILFDEVNCLPPARLFMLHELIENRKLFSKDAPADKCMIDVHTDCRILLAMNPPTAGYSGTNRLNIALSSRPIFIEVPCFTPEEIGVDTGNAMLDSQILKFYSETRRIIKQNNLRVSMSIRNVNRIANAVKKGASVKKAVEQGFINSALATASEVERGTLKDIARTVFGADVMDNLGCDINSAWGDNA